MTLVELFIVTALCAACIVGALVVGAVLGPFGYPLGCMLGPFGLAGLVAGVAELDVRWRWGSPFMPTCRRGTCNADAYKLTCDDSVGETSFVWECRCGDRYLKCGPRVFVLRHGREPQPYMKWLPFRAWAPDTAGRPASGGPYRS